MENNTFEVPVNKDNENIRIMGLLLLAGFLVPYIGGWLCVLVFYILKKDSFNAEETAVFWEIMNFNLSFFVFGVIAGCLVILLIGLLLLPIVLVTYFILLILSIIQYIGGKSYRYPLIIRFIQQ